MSDLGEEHLVSGRPASKSRNRIAVRVTENFFRRWPLYVLPVLLLTAFGAYRAVGVTKEFRSNGSINVASSTPIDDLTGTSPDFGYETPATKTARNINQLLSTDAFALTVAKAAGLGDLVATGSYSLVDLRGALSATPAGDNLLSIGATSTEPVLAQKMAKALIDSYTQYIVSSETAGFESAAAFIQTELTAAQAAVTAAVNALDTYLADHPAPSSGADRPDTEAIQIQRLTDTVTSTQTRLDKYEDQLNQAKLSVKQSESSISQRLQLIDEPAVPVSPESTLMKRILQLAVFVVLGVAVGIAALVLVSVLDRKVYTAADVRGIEGLIVIATIPTLKRGNAKGKTKGKRRSTIVPELVTAGGPPT